MHRPRGAEEPLQSNQTDTATGSAPLARIAERSSLPRSRWAMTQPDVAALFDLLDRWRHLPSYRLEPRADAIFGLFLPDTLDRHLAPRGIAVDPLVIPEFPLGQIDTRRSDKADFLQYPGTAGMPS